MGRDTDEERNQKYTYFLIFSYKYMTLETGQVKWKQ